MKKTTRYYHVWFQTKLKKRLLLDEIDKRISELFDEISKEKGIDLLAQGSLVDHAHLLVALQIDQDLAWAVKMFKGISARKILQEYHWICHEFRVNNFWARKYGAKEIPIASLTKVTRYILNQKKDLHL